MNRTHLHTLAAMAAIGTLGGVHGAMPMDPEIRRMLRAPRGPKYPGQRQAHLIGAHCEEGRKMRAAQSAAEKGGG